VVTIREEKISLPQGKKDGWRKTIQSIFSVKELHLGKEILKEKNKYQWLSN